MLDILKAIIFGIVEGNYGVASDQQYGASDFDGRTAENESG